MINGSANLDLLRSVAVLTVYAAHLVQIFGITQIGPFSNMMFSHAGVVIFFVHTSLVLMLSMERLKLPTVQLFTAFYVRRAFRIYPLAVATVLCAVIFSVPSFPTYSYVAPDVGTVVSNLSLMQNFTGHQSLLAPLWSLPIEVQMYAALPVLFLLVRRYPHWEVPVIISILAAALASSETTRTSLIQYAPCFMGGILAFVLSRQRRWQLPFWGWPISIGVCYWIQTIGLEASWIAAIFLGAAIPQFSELQEPRARRVVAAIAKYSYGIYLSHVIIFWFCFFALPEVSLAIRFALCAALSIIVPVALYHAIEAPMIRIGVKVAQQLTGTGTGKRTKNKIKANLKPLNELP